MHVKCDFNEKERVFRSYLHLRTKTLEDLRKKTTTKKFRLDRSRRESKEKFEKSFEKVMNT